MSRANEPCKFLAWDSEFFGLRIGRVLGHRLTAPQSDAVDAWCEERDIDCVYFLAVPDDPETVRLASDGGYRLVDIRVELDHRAPARGTGDQPGNAQADLRAASHQDLSRLEQIAGSSYTDSRFYFDEGFPSERCDDLYRTWVRRDLEAASTAPVEHALLVADVDRVPAGFISCHVESAGPPGDADTASGTIGLVGVAADARGRQVGSLLVDAARRWFADRGCDTVSVVTQGRNIGAQRLYQGRGFRTRAMGLWYHRWRDQ